MNFSRGLFKRAAPAFNQNGRKQFSSIPQTLYNNVWGKSNIAYITYIVVGCVAIEFVYGGVTTSIWESANKGVRDAAWTADEI